jgi:hypothetical protein
MRARDSQGWPIDPRVVAVCEGLWPWAYRHVERELHDPASAAQLNPSGADPVFRNSGKLDELRSQVAALRIRIEEPLRHVERGRTPLET